MENNEFKRKIFNRLDNMDENMDYIFNALIEHWSTVKMVLYFYYCENQDVLSKSNKDNNKRGRE